MVALPLSTLCFVYTRELTGGQGLSHSKRELRSDTRWIPERLRTNRQPRHRKIRAMAFKKNPAERRTGPAWPTAAASP
eukprot:365574-Chlamydomonas_euryale.AAC.5